MTDNDFDHGSDWDDDGNDFFIHTEENVEVVEEEPHDEPVAEEPVQETVEQDKPAFGIWKYGKFGPEGGVLTTEHQGPQVAYINNKFNIEGDKYTRETYNAVLNYQRENRLRVSGRVDKATYDAL